MIKLMLLSVFNYNNTYVLGAEHDLSLYLILLAVAPELISNTSPVTLAVTLLAKSITARAISSGWYMIR